MLLVHNYYLVLGESSRLPWVLAVDGGTSRAHQSNWHKVTATVSSSRAQGEYQQRVGHISNDFDLLAPVFVACNTDVGEGIKHIVCQKSVNYFISVYFLDQNHTFVMLPGFHTEREGGEGAGILPLPATISPLTEILKLSMAWLHLWKLCVCLRPYTVNFKWANLNISWRPNVLR